MANPTGTINADEDHSGRTIIKSNPTAAQDAATKAYADSIAGGGVNAFGTIAVSGQSSVVADAAPDTLTFVAGTGVTLTTDAITDTVTIAATSGGGGNVSNSGTPTSGQLGQWTDATHIAGIDSIALSQLPQGTNGQLIVAQTGGPPAYRTISGDIAIGLTGAAAIPNDTIHSYQILNGAVQYAKIQNVSANSKLLGSSATGSGAPPSEITLGTNLSISGSTLNATGGGGGTIASTSDILKGDGSGNAVALGSATSGKILKSNGTNFIASTETVAAPGSSGNVLTSDGTNWTSAAPTATVTAPLTLTLSDTANVTVSDVLTLSHNSTGTPGAGFGTELLFQGESSTTDNQIMGSIRAAWSVATDASRLSYLQFRGGASTGLANATMNVWPKTGAGGGVDLGVGADPGSGVLTTVNGFTINNVAPTSGKILQSNGTTYKDSTPTWPTSGGTSGYIVRTDGTNFALYPKHIVNSSTASVAASYAADTYLAGSSCVVAAGADFKAKGQYHCVFDMVKTGAGTAAPVISVRIGTTGTVASDTARLTFTFSAGTAVIDSGIFEVWVTWRSVGSGTSAVVQGICRAQHNLATTGLFSDAAIWTIVATPSGGFDSSTATTIGLSFNGGSSFSGTNTLVQASLEQP